MNKHIKQTNRYLWSRRGTQTLLCGAALLVAPLVIAQDDEEDEEIFELSPFTVEGSEDQGYRATSTLAGSRIRTDLKDVGSAISVITEEFLRDTGAVDNSSLFQYTTSTEVGGIGGNFAGEERLGMLNPNANTRVRGLQAADNTRDYFLTDLPWDGYNVNRVDMQRGPNAILSGLGSPAGLVNNTTDSAIFEDEGEVQVRFGSYGSTRFHFNVNRVILEDELSVRVAAVKKDDKYRQEEAWAEDERFFVAMKYEPKFLKSESNTTTLTANFESGNINSNRPRTRPPVDRLSGFWEEDSEGRSQITGHPLALGGEETLDGSDDPAQYPPVYVRGVQQTGDAYFNQVNFNNPWYGENYTDGPIVYFANADQGDGDATYASVGGISASDNNILYTRLIDPNGDAEGPREVAIDAGGTGYPFYRAISSPAGLGAAARNLGLPLAQFGGYGNELLYDRSIFDYKNHLLDGDNKREFQDFQVSNVKLAQTFYNNRLGLEVALNKETYGFGQTSPFGWGPEITIDVNSHLADFSPNPNVGRPVIFRRTQGSSSDSVRDRDSSRYTVFGELREGDLFETDSFLGKLIGKQRLTGVKSSDDIILYEQGFKNWLADDTYRAYMGNSGLATNEAEVMAAVYLGPSVIGTSSPAGLNLQPVPKLNPNAINSIRIWDSYWSPTNPNAPTVDYLDSEWISPYQDDPSTQQNNPANYTGWRDHPASFLIDTEGDRLSLITSARSSSQEIESEAFVWQGFFWDGAVVALYGNRDDTTTQINVTAPRIPGDPREIFDPTGATPFQSGGSYLAYTEADALAERARNEALGSVNKFEGSNESKSVVVHLDQFLPELPASTKFSVFWNESSNFQPGEARVNHLNQPLAPPNGDTEDYGFVISTFNDKLTLKLNRYESTVYGSTYDPTDGALWYVGTAETSLFAAGMRDLVVIEGNTPGWDDSWRTYGQQNPYQVGDVPYDNWLRSQGIPESEWADQTVEEADAWMARATANLRENLAPQEFWDAWGATQSDARWQNGWWDPWSESTGVQPNGFTSTSDITSKGTEIEVNFNPTENWNFAMNAAKTEAVRNNLAGSLKEWVSARNEVHNGDNGDIRLWWAGDRNNTLKTRWNNDFYSRYLLGLATEGTAVSELREWRVNMVTNYNFRDGKFKGLNLGGSVRWEDEVGIGYEQTEGVNEDGVPVLVYLSDSPIMGPTETHLDLWAGYSLDLNDNVNWRIQLNVRDVLSDGGLVPISVNPDGSVREYRVQGDPNWFLTNTFSF
ncbi:TonB-dependent receptor plug domain protein [Verrucomicrobiia bacterium DG1235]|nr:TonB-dependent receptor plug domain protein [Verrucomicrobiae bacterium DG1235]